MGNAETRLERRAWKETQDALLCNPEFIRERIAPLLPEAVAKGGHPECAAAIVRNKAAGRLTLRYSVGECAPLYGKAYFENADASEAYRQLTHLWRNGFAEGSILKVPEPLGLIPESNLVVMRCAKGASMDTRRGAGSIDAALGDARLAARWLVRFHGTEMPGLRAETPVERLEILKIADALSKVAAEFPDHFPLLIEMVHDLRSVAPKSNWAPPVVPVHGQFRPGHVFIQDGAATVIDIEKLCLSDPARDVARFCHVLRKTCMEEGGDMERADRITQEFIDEYRVYAEQNLQNLPYFSALLALKAFAKLLKNRKVGDAQREAMSQGYRSEFDRSVQRGLVSRMAA